MITQMRVQEDDIDVLHFAALSVEQARQVEQFCHTLQPDRDCEDPFGARSLLAFVHHHNFTLEPTAPLFGTICLFLRDGGELIGLASIVPDDRGLSKDLGITDATGVWAGVLVPHQWRGHGIGSLLARALRSRCQAYADSTRTAQKFYLFTNNPTAASIYQQRAQFVHDRSFQRDQQTQHLYSRTFHVQVAPEACETLIIGAGMAGISAARHHRALDPSSSVMLLEARDRIGGRCCSTSHAEIGAGWIHGQHDNPLIALAAELQVKVVEAMPDNIWRRADPRLNQIELYTVSSTVGQRWLSDFELAQSSTNGEQEWTDVAIGPCHTEPATMVDMSQSIEIFELYQSQIARIAANIVGSDSDDSSQSDQSEINLTVAEAWRTCIVTSDLPVATRAALQWHLRLMQSWFGLPIEHISASALLGDEHWGDFAGPHYLVNGGFSALALAATASLDVRLSADVETIDYSNSAHVEVRCRDGRRFQCQRLICTLPVPVLKQHAVTLFKPALPVAKQSAIASARVIQYKKVVLHFNSCFWQSGSKPITLIGLACESSRGLHSVFECRRHAAGDGTVVAEFVGPHAAIAERISDSILIRLVLDALHSIPQFAALCNSRQLRLLGATVSHWQSDPHSRGAYIDGCAEQDADDDMWRLIRLCEPIDIDDAGQSAGRSQLERSPRIWFAGDGFDAEHCGSVAGAFNSGVDVVNDMLGQ